MALLDTPVMHVDGTVTRVNRNNTAPADEIEAKKAANFEVRYDSIIQTAEDYAPSVGLLQGWV